LLRWFELEYALSAEDIILHKFAQAGDNSGMNKMLTRHRVEAVRLNDRRQLLQRVATGLRGRRGIEVAYNRTMFRDAVERNLDFFDFILGKQAPGYGVAMLMERAFHFVQIHRGRQLAGRGRCGNHSIEVTPPWQRWEWMKIVL